MKIGFIGLGNMGRHMALHVLEGGHDLTVFDLSRDAGRPLEGAGATWANSPAETARGADIVFTSLPLPANVLEVATGEGGVLSAISPGAVFIDLSTIDPDTAKTLDAAVRAAGAHALDSPVSGGTVGADQLERLGENLVRHQTFHPCCEFSDILRIRFSLVRVIPTYNTR